MLRAAYILCCLLVACLLLCACAASPTESDYEHLLFLDMPKPMSDEEEDMKIAEIYKDHPTIKIQRRTQASMATFIHVSDATKNPQCAYHGPLSLFDSYLPKFPVSYETLFHGCSWVKRWSGSWQFYLKEQDRDHVYDMVKIFKMPIHLVGTREPTKHEIPGTWYYYWMPAFLMNPELEWYHLSNFTCTLQHDPINEIVKKLVITNDPRLQFYDFPPGYEIPGLGPIMGYRFYLFPV